MSTTKVPDSPENPGLLGLALITPLVRFIIVLFVTIISALPARAANPETKTVFYESHPNGIGIYLTIKPAVKFNGDVVEQKVGKIPLVGQAFAVFDLDETTISLGPRNSKSAHSPDWNPQTIGPRIIQVLQKQKELRGYKFMEKTLTSK